MDRFQTAMKALLKVPKAELDKKLQGLTPQQTKHPAKPPARRNPRRG